MAHASVADNDMQIPEPERRWYIWRDAKGREVAWRETHDVVGNHATLARHPDAVHVTNPPPPVTPCAMCVGMSHATCIVNGCLWVHYREGRGLSSTSLRWYMDADLEVKNASIDELLLDILQSLEWSSSRKGAEPWHGGEAMVFRSCPKCYGLHPSDAAHNDNGVGKWFADSEFGHREYCVVVEAIKRLTGRMGRG